MKESWNRYQQRMFEMLAVRTEHAVLGNTISPVNAAEFLLLVIIVLSPGAGLIWSLIAGFTWVIWLGLLTINNFARASNASLTVLTAQTYGTSLHLPWYADVIGYIFVVHLHLQHLDLTIAFFLVVVILSDLGNRLLYEIMNRLGIWQPITVEPA